MTTTTPPIPDTAAAPFTPPSSPRGYRTRARRTLSVLTALVDTRHDLLTVGDVVKLDLRELAEWSLDETNARLLHGLVRLGDLRTQLLLSRFRTTAAFRLLEYISQKEFTETSRKACLDLLTTNMDHLLAAGAGPLESERSSSVQSAEGTPTEAPSLALDEAAVRRAFEALEAGEA